MQNVAPMNRTLPIVTEPSVSSDSQSRREMLRLWHLPGAAIALRGDPFRRSLLSKDHAHGSEVSALKAEVLK